MKFSIIIPHYNRSALLAESLGSVLAQDYTNFECIVVDDGSSLEEYEKIREHASGEHRIHVVQRPEGSPKGANSCRNIGAEISTGNYLMFLDSDDLLARTCLASRAEAAKLYPDADMLIFNMARFKNTPGDMGEVVNKARDVKGATHLLHYFLAFKLPWPITSVLWKRDFFRKIRFDENLLRFQDMDAHIHALTRTQRIRLYPHADADCFYRISTFHEGADSRQKQELVFENCTYLIDKWRKRLAPVDACYLAGTLLFLANRYHAVITRERQRMLFRLYRDLGIGFLSNPMAELTLLTSWNAIAGMPGMPALRQRFYYFGREKVLKDKR